MSVVYKHNCVKLINGLSIMFKLTVYGSLNHFN